MGDAVAATHTHPLNGNRVCLSLREPKCQDTPHSYYPVLHMQYLFKEVFKQITTAIFLFYSCYFVYRVPELCNREDTVTLYRHQLPIYRAC